VQDVVAGLLAWFRRNARTLPWREVPREPYRVLVSELMLQQTQVDRVIPKYESFLEAFPDLESLADASEEEVLAVWSGLGYYRRAKLLHRLARAVMAGSGSLPEGARELEKLPGVGPYTAAAVASLAFGEAVPVLDGNVVRVASRVLAFAGDPRSSAGRRALSGWAAPLVEAGPAGEINEALMELGATVCTPASPRCEDCPLAESCGARAGGRPDNFPRPRPTRASVKLRWVAACCIDRHGRWLVRKIEDGPILRDLWLPPIATLDDGEDPVERAVDLAPGPVCGDPEVLPGIDHSITHRRIQVVPVRFRVPNGTVGDAGDRWIAPGSSPIATSSLLNKLFDVSDLESEYENE